MIIQGNRFALQFPRRVDLSGRPLGALFIWFTGKKVAGRFTPIAAREFGFYIGSNEFIDGLLKRFKRTEWKECYQLLDRDVPLPHDWKKWPEDCLKGVQAAVDRELRLRGQTPAAIVKDLSFCDRRIDLSGQPLQLMRAIKVKQAA